MTVTAAVDSADRPAAWADALLLSFAQAGYVRAEPGILQKTPRPGKILVRDQHAARQHAERAFQHAHVLIEHQMVDAGAVEQSHDPVLISAIVGADQFAHRCYRFPRSDADLRLFCPGARCAR